MLNAQRKANTATPPSAIFCMSDIFAIGVSQAVSENGLKIPQDISLVGFDNRFFSENQVPALTTIELPLYQMGLEAGKLIHRIILGVLRGAVESEPNCPNAKRKPCSTRSFGLFIAYEICFVKGFWGLQKI